MVKKLSARNFGLIAIAGSFAIVAGLVAGSAVANNAPDILTPEGVSVADGLPHSPAPVPTYETNEAGQTVGSAAEAINPETQPDLIEALATNGQSGYVLRVDLEKADGTTASAEFTSPEEALKWQETQDFKPISIPVYEADGVTEIGVFLVQATYGKVLPAG